MPEYIPRVSDEELRKFLSEHGQTDDDITKTLGDEKRRGFWEAQYLYYKPIIEQAPPVDPATKAALDRREKELKCQIEASQPLIGQFERYINGGRGRK